MARRSKKTKLTTNIRKLAAQIINVSADPLVERLAGEIVTEAGLLDARDERKKPTVRRPRKTRKTARRKATAKRPAVKVARRRSRPKKVRRPAVSRPLLTDES